MSTGFLTLGIVGRWWGWSCCQAESGPTYLRCRSRWVMMGHSPVSPCALTLRACYAGDRQLGNQGRQQRKPWAHVDQAWAFSRTGPPSSRSLNRAGKMFSQSIQGLQDGAPAFRRKPEPRRACTGARCPHTRPTARGPALGVLWHGHFGEATHGGVQRPRRDGQANTQNRRDPFADRFWSPRMGAAIFQTGGRRFA